jgi:hypothetical protein
MGMKKLAVTTVISAVGFSIAPFASLARADLRNTPATMCYAASGSPVVDNVGQLAALGGTVDLICPITPDETTPFKHHNAGAAIEGFQENAFDVTVKACVTWYGGGGGSCGAESSYGWGGESYGIAANDLSAWQAAGTNDFPYLAVHIDGGQSTLAGYSYSVFF